MNKLVLSDIHHYFEKKPLFDGLNLHVKQGEVACIVGTSGVGKSTLFNIASGLITPSRGQVWIDNQDTTGQAGFVGYMLQKDLLLSFKSVYDNIALPLVLKKQSKAIIQSKISEQLDSFGLKELVHKYPHELSGGQRQRAALLRTYLSNQSLMLLDEPFSALDFVTKSQMYAWFKAFCQKHQLTCLIITHDIDEAIYLSNKVYVLKGFPANISHGFDIPKDDNFLHTQAYLALKQKILDAICSKDNTNLII